jgi:small subunit ribosomal protein S29
VVGAISSTNTTYSLSPELRVALGIQPELENSPFARVPAEITEFTQGIKPVEVPSKLSVSEASAMFEIWMKNLSLHTCELFLRRQ